MAFVKRTIKSGRVKIKNWYYKPLQPTTLEGQRLVFMVFDYNDRVYLCGKTPTDYRPVDRELWWLDSKKTQKH